MDELTHINSLEFFANQHVFIVGGGREGRSLQHIMSNANRPAKSITIVDQQQGVNYLEPIRAVPEAERIVIKSSGIPPQNVPFTYITPTQIFFSIAKRIGATLVGVTGTKGKSTTVELLRHILEKSGRPHVVGGNMGIPMTDLLSDLEPSSLVILELSSFMLQELRQSPHIAIITNLMTDHLDFHKSRENYIEAKTNLIKHQAPTDHLVIPANDAELARVAKQNTQAAISLADSQAVFAIPNILGDHNAALASLAVKAAEILGIPKQQALAHLASAQPLPHRLEVVGTKNQITLINDSIASQIDASIVGIETVSTLFPSLGGVIVGGMDRGVELNPLVQALIAAKPSSVACISTTGLRIHEQLGQRLRSKHFPQDNLEAALGWTMSHAKPGSAILFSPGAPCYLLADSRINSRWENFEQRGQTLKQAFEDIAAQ